MIIGEHAFHVNEPGLASCFELTTGKDLWNKDRLTGKTWGSPVHADGKIYITNFNGETIVFKPNPDKIDVLAQNKLPDTVLASIAIADGDILIRGYKFLWCVAK